MNIYFAQVDLKRQAGKKERKMKKRQFNDVKKAIKCGSWKKYSLAEENFEHKKNAFKVRNGKTQ